MSAAPLSRVWQPLARRTTRRWLARVVAAAGLSVALVAGGAAGAVGLGVPRPGSPRSGDSLFPFAGNGGYDALHYRVALAYHPRRNRIDAVTRMRARAHHPLSSFYLDLSGLHVRSVHVNGRVAHFTRHGHKLRIRPVAPVRGLFRTSVVYDGRPRVHIDADKSREGWIRTRDGATALGEPVGTMTWIPVDNTPRDKARYTFQVSAPARLTVAANGVLVRRVRHEGRVTTWTWREPVPMASYLAMVSIGRYRMFHATITSVTGRHIPVWSFVHTALPSQLRARR
jgi:aminopeptidase N